MSDGEAIAEALEDLASKTHRHVSDAIGGCDPRFGDRCDITAAYRNAALIARNYKTEAQE
jgi:hypothetical protein